jgi:hypothetical protein
MRSFVPLDGCGVLSVLEASVSAERRQAMDVGLDDEGQERQGQQGWRRKPRPPRRAQAEARAESAAHALHCREAIRRPHERNNIL